jgi:hypothetical protein
MDNFSLEEANQKVKDTLSRFEEYESNFDKYFELYKDHGNCIVHKASPKGEPVIVRGQLTINFPPEKCVDFIYNMPWDKRNKMTPEMVSTEIVKK